MTSKLIGALIAVVIGLALLPVVGSFTDTLIGDGGMYANTTTGALIELLPLVYVIVVVASAVGYVSLSNRE